MNFNIIQVWKIILSLLFVLFSQNTRLDPSEIMDASWENNLEEELLCPICLNVFEQPIQLPCRHNFCKGCISEAWAKYSAAVRCPECNHHYEQKPPLERNSKLANIVKRFNALHSGKVPAVLDCALCRRGSPLPVRKVCLRCKEPCCQAHVQLHLQQPCAAPGHLLVDAEELSAWTCPSHEEYRLFHCEEEQVALCPFCCISHCANQRHTVCDVNTRRLQIQVYKRQPAHAPQVIYSTDFPTFKRSDRCITPSQKLPFFPCVH